MKWVEIALVFVGLVAISSAMEIGPQSRSRSRSRRDLICASGGNRACNFLCKGKGYKEGQCSWDTDTGAFNCNCSRDMRGIRCNLGGQNTCFMSCIVMGYSQGSCDAFLNCNCGGQNTRWGIWLQEVRNRL